MDLKREKEKIKKELDKIDDVRIINGIKWFINQYDPADVPVNNTDCTYRRLGDVYTNGSHSYT